MEQDDPWCTMANPGKPEHSINVFTIGSGIKLTCVCVYVLQPLDFDSLLRPFVNVTVYVQDTDPNHVDTAYIEVTITDFNDNAPTFFPNSNKVTIFENVTIGTTLYRFNAADKDIGVNKLFVYVFLP
jgi:hypothetical protein